MKKYLALLPLLASYALFSQQTVDNSGAKNVKPWPIVYSFPGVCAFGEMVTYAPTAAPNNMYECGFSNDWHLFTGSGGGATIPSTSGALKGDGSGNALAVTGTGSNCVHADGTSAVCGSGGATQIAQLTDFQATITTVSTANDSVTGNSGCSSANPCNLGWQQVTTPITSSFLCTLSGTSSSGTLWAYAYQGTFNIAQNTAATWTCPSGATAVSGQNGFPAGARPQWTQTFTANAMNIGGYTKALALIEQDTITGGSGLTGPDSNGNIAVDYTKVPKLCGSGTSAPAGGATPNCTTGSFYLNTSAPQLYVCTATSGACSGVSAANWATTGGGATYNPMDFSTLNIVQPACGTANSNFNGSWFQAYGGTNGDCQAAVSANSTAYYHSDTGSAGVNAETHFTWIGGVGNVLTSGATFKSPKFYWRGSISSVTTVYFVVALGSNFLTDNGTSNFIGIKYDSSVDTNYKCVIRVGNTTTANIDTGVVANTSFHTFKLDTAPGVLTCTIDGTAVTASAAFPTLANIYPNVGIQTLASVANYQLNTEYAGFQVTGLVR